MLSSGWGLSVNHARTRYDNGDAGFGRIRTHPFFVFPGAVNKNRFPAQFSVAVLFHGGK